MPRTLIVGFDGATWDVALPLVAEGRMPVLAGLMGDGSWARMRSVFPYNSAVAWTSLVTGVSAGRHGLFDFVLPREDRYAMRVATGEDRRVPAIWNHVSDSGGRVGVFGIPMTFPAEPVSGYVISGMDAPGLEERSVHPKSLLGDIARIRPDYKIISKAYIRAEHGEWAAAERELVDVVVDRSRLVEELARPRDLDMIIVDLEATDGSHHFFWQHFDPSHPRHDPALAGQWGGTIGRVYETCDRELGRLIDAYAPDTVFVVSDHGGGPSRDYALFMNDWLEAEGFLTVQRKASASVAKRAYTTALKHLSHPFKQRLQPLFGRFIERAKGLALFGDVDWARTRAYGTVQSMVRLNLAGREPEGTVSRAERDQVLAELAERARARTFPDGLPLFTNVARAEEIYEVDGAVPGLPDLVVEPQVGTEVRGRNTSGRPGFLLPLKDLGVWYPSGEHTPVGLVVAAGAGIARQGEVPETHIQQVAPSVLAVMGVPAPTLPMGPFPFVQAELQSTGQEVAGVGMGGGELTEDEEAEVLERLRGLGYVD